MKNQLSVFHDRMGYIMLYLSTRFFENSAAHFFLASTLQFWSREPIKMTLGCFFYPSPQSFENYWLVGQTSKTTIFKALGTWVQNIPGSFCWLRYFRIEEQKLKKVSRKIFKKSGRLIAHPLLTFDFVHWYHSEGRAACYPLLCFCYGFLPHH